jgi:hypothetical protein
MDGSIRVIIDIFQNTWKVNRALPDIELGRMNDDRLYPSKEKNP